MEVYAVTREFQEWGKGLYNRLPTPIRNGLKAAGVCHYMVVVREGPEGDLYSFDFGPVGGDVHGSLAGFPKSQLCFDDVVPGSLPMRRSQSTPALFKEAPEEEDELDEPVEATVEILAAGKDPAAAAATDGSSTAGGKSRRRRPLGRREKKWVVGEIREHKIDELPEGTHFLGTTEMTLDDIRDFNAGRSKMYALHDNDCRHYMNELCSRLVPDLQKLGRGGVASKVAWDATWGRLRSGRPEIHLLPIQAMADLRNQPALERIKTASMASVMFSLGMRALPIVFKPVLPLATAVGNAGPVRRLVTTAAGAVAGVSSEVPIVREALFAGNVAMESISGVAHGLVRGSVNLVHATSGTVRFLWPGHGARGGVRGVPRRGERRAGNRNRHGRDGGNSGGGGGRSTGREGSVCGGQRRARDPQRGHEGGDRPQEVRLRAHQAPGGKGHEETQLQLEHQQPVLQAKLLLHLGKRGGPRIARRRSRCRRGVEGKEASQAAELWQPAAVPTQVGVSDESRRGNHREMRSENKNKYEEDTLQRHHDEELEYRRWMTL
jgi:hypothetical protein